MNVYIQMHIYIFNEGGKPIKFTVKRDHTARLPE